MIKACINPISVGVPPAVVTIVNNRVSAKIAREVMTRADWTTHDYNVHFLLSLENDREVTEEVEILVECENYLALPKRQPLLYTASKITGPWQLSNLEARTDGKKSYALRVHIPANSEFHIANTLPRPLASIQEETNTLAKHCAARIHQYGTSLEGRPLVAIQFGNPSGIPILITSGFHPPEPDTIATLAILQWLSTEEGESMGENLHFTIVPVVNPDGYARATQGSNAAGINLYWHFAKELPEQCPEAVALWNLASELEPKGYIDFHCYTFQLD